MRCAAVYASARAVGCIKISLVNVSLITSNHRNPLLDFAMYRKSAEITSPGAFGMILCDKGHTVVIRNTQEHSISCEDR